MKTYTLIFKANVLNLRIFVTQIEADWPSVGMRADGKVSLLPEVEGRMKRKVAETCCFTSHEKMELMRNLELIAIVNSTQTWDLGAHLAVAYEVSGGWTEG